VIVDQSRVRAVVLDTGELAADHARSFARHRVLTDLGHARQLKAARGARAEAAVEVRPLSVYDALIA